MQWRDWEREARIAAQVGRKLRFRDAARNSRFDVVVDSVTDIGFSGFVVNWGDAKKMWLTFPYKNVRNVVILAHKVEL